MIKKIGVYTNKIPESSIIDDIYELFIDSDFTIFTDDLKTNELNFSIMSSYYMLSYSGNVIFLDLNDLLEYQNRIIGKPYLYIDKNIEHRHISIYKTVDLLFYNDTGKLEFKTNEIR